MFTSDGTASSPGTPTAKGTAALEDACKGTSALLSQLMAFAEITIPVLPPLGEPGRVAFSWRIVGMEARSGSRITVPAITSSCCSTQFSAAVVDAWWPVSTSTYAACPASARSRAASAGVSVSLKRPSMSVALPAAAAAAASSRLRGSKRRPTIVAAEQVVVAARGRCERELGRAGGRPAAGRSCAMGAGRGRVAPGAAPQSCTRVRGAGRRGRCAGAWQDDRDLVQWFYRSLLEVAKRHRIPGFALEPTPRLPLPMRDSYIAQTVKKACEVHSDTLVVVIVGQTHLVGDGSHAGFAMGGYLGI